MEDNKDLQKDIVDFDQIETVNDNVQVKGMPEKKAGWGSKGVTRKFLVIALAATVLVNAALSAGMMALFAKNSKSKMPDMRDGGFHGNGFPGSEMFNDGDQDGSGMMTPPGDGQNGSFDQSSKASIGIVIKEDSGVIVAQVSGDNAKKAGFSEGDKIVSIDGKTVNSSEDLISEVRSHSAGDVVIVTVERDGQTIELKTELE